MVDRISAIINILPQIDDVTELFGDNDGGTTAWQKLAALDVIIATQHFRRQLSA